MTLPQFSGNSLEWPQWFGLFQALVDNQVSLSETEKNGASSGFSDRAGEEDDRRVHV